MLSETNLPHYVRRVSGISNGSGLWSQDLLGLSLARREVISRPYDLLKLFGRTFGSTLEPIIYQHVGEKPVQVSQMRSGGFGGWVTYVSNVRALFSDWNFKADVPLLEENDVKHFNLSGTVRTGASATTAYRDYSQLLGPGPFHYYFRLSGDTGAPVITDLQFPPYFTPIGLLGQEELSLFVTEVSGGSWDRYLSDGRLMQYFGFKYELCNDLDDDTRLLVVYSYKLWNLVSGGKWRQDAYTCRLKFRFVPVPHYAAMDVEQTLYDYVNYLVVHEADILVFNQIVEPAGTLPSETWTSSPGLHDTFSNDGIGGSPILLNTYVVFYHGAASSRITDMTGYSEGAGRYVLETGASMSEFKSRAYGVYSDALILNWFSARDAIDTHFETISSNHIEAVLELTSICQLLDLEKAILALVSKRKRGFIALLNLLSDVKLLYAFGIAPTLSDAKETGDAVRAFRKKLLHGNLFRMQTIYGKFSYPLPQEYFPGFEGVHITARSKIRIGIEPDSFLASVVTARTMGFLPSFSSIWDLIPLSFVVDWFTNIGNIARAGEDALLMLALNVPGSVNSIKIEYPFQEYDELHYNFEVVDDGSFTGYRLFDRYSLSGLPFLVPSKLPVFAAHGVPDWALAGSLLYKFL